MSETFEYVLTHPIKYGEKTLTVFKFNAPVVRHMALVAKIKEGYSSAQLDILSRLKASGIDLESQSGNEDTAQSDTDKIEGVISVLNSACVGSVDIYENAKALFLSTGIGTLDNSPIQAGHLDKVGIKDFTDMTAQYIAFFILPGLQ